MQKIGIIGNSGRVGKILVDVINKVKKFINGKGFSRTQIPMHTLKAVFEDNDYVVDFSKPELVPEILTVADKPLVICTTGWSMGQMQSLVALASQKVPLVIASNTSMGAYFQQMLVQKLASMLGEDFDIDIFERHHRQKADAPSGTAKALLGAVQDAKKAQGLDYQPYSAHGLRPAQAVGMQAQRSGNIFGEHEVSFTNEDERIVIGHVAFSRAIFAKGALQIVKWLHAHKPTPGVYTMQDIVK